MARAGLHNHVERVQAEDVGEDLCAREAIVHPHLNPFNFL